MVKSGQASAVEITRATVDFVTAGDTVRAFSALWPEEALTQAAEVDRRLRAGQSLPLAGVPIGVKASEGLTSFQTRRLLETGCVPIGATSVPGPGTSWRTWGATSAGPTLNPHCSAWSPGGSSAGSAAAVATGLVPLATGSDGAGSVRIPAAWCGVLGLKPTNGLVPARDRAGLNIAGPLASTAADAACYLDVIAGTDTLTELTRLARLARFSLPPPRPLRVAWSADLGFADTVPRVAATALSFVERLEGSGAVALHDVAVRFSDPAPYWRALRTTSAWTDTTAAPDLPRDPASALLLPGISERVSGLRRQLDQVLDRVDLIACPTTPNPPHGHEGPGPTMSVALTWTVNITGHPAISIPCGLTALGEPVGLQFIAAHHHETDLLALAQIAEDLP